MRVRFIKFGDPLHRALADLRRLTLIKGKYLHPELYGQPKERGIHYHPLPKPTHEVAPQH